MPIYRLPRVPVFPPPEDADESGLLAVGGDLSPVRLIRAYRLGIFPWYDENTPILWWCPDPRLVLEPAELHISRSLRKTLKKRAFHVTADTAFLRVLAGCAAPRHRGDDDDGTWLTPAMQRAYYRLHRLGLAHSVEVWWDRELAGGLYGVFLGHCFYGESMFSRRSDASKVALVALVRYLEQIGDCLIDCQMTTPHLIRMGAKEIPREAFLERLKVLLDYPTSTSRWRFDDALIAPPPAPHQR